MYHHPQSAVCCFLPVSCNPKSEIRNPKSTRTFLYRLIPVAIYLFLLPASLIAGEGMWLPLLLKSLNEAEMKSMGMKMSAEDIYSVNAGSLKDAVIHFNGGCTGEVISNQGLILTNHHCGYDAIQNHSTLESNYLTHGYWAMSRAEELPNPGYFVQFIIRIDDVTSQVKMGVTSSMSGSEMQSVMDKNIHDIMASTAKEEWQEVTVKPFFEGHQFYAFVTETYRDIRLVGAPPESIGKFGADTDNWVWPRHTGDFAVFRIYAGPDNRPAEYSPDNKPFIPRHYFPISLDGVTEGDFTLVFGFPGQTMSYLPSFGVEQTVDVVDPARVGVREISLSIMDKYMRQDEGIRLAYASKFASLSNYWKKWIGEMQGLKSKNAVGIKQKQEAEFTTILMKNPALQMAYGHLLNEMEAVYEQLDPIIENRSILAEIIGGFNIDLFRLTTYADRLANAYQENGDEGYKSYGARLKNGLPGFFEDYDVMIDREVFDALMHHMTMTVSATYLPDGWNVEMNTADQVYGNSILAAEETFLSAIDLGGEMFVQKLASDKAYQLYLTFKDILDTRISPVYHTLQDQLQTYQSQYMRALMDAYPDKRFWPDANGTLRVTYGQVETYAPRDGMMYKTQTYLEGVMEKYVPDDYEFDVHSRLIELYEQKDYGPYGENGKMPVCFIASNHTTGGNSGSPAIDAYGNLIGINFDRVWEGTMSDLYYDRSICRNIMVDIRYVLFVIDKFADADWLLQEMMLVHPKNKKPKRGKKKK